MAVVEQKIVDTGEAGMRLDRWFKVHYPGLGFGHLQKLLRSGQIRIDGSRAKADTRVQAGQTVRIPPLGVDEKATGPVTARTIRSQQDGDVLSQMLLYEDPKVYVFNKPAGLAVQGGSGVTRHIDGMLEAWRNKRAKSRVLCTASTVTRRVCWSWRAPRRGTSVNRRFSRARYQEDLLGLGKGVPRKREDKISTWLVKDQTPDGDKMRVCQHGEPDSDHAVSYYRIIEKAGNNLTWLEMEPYTGRTHQLRVHAAYIGHPIIGDPKYFEADQNWEFPGGIQKRLHLHARRIRIPNPSGGIIDVTAPLPPHMVQSWNLLGFDEESAED